MAGLSPDVAQNVGYLDLAVVKGAIEFVKLMISPTNGTGIHGCTPTVLADECGQHEGANSLLHNRKS